MTARQIIDPEELDRCRKTTILPPRFVVFPDGTIEDIEYRNLDRFPYYHIANNGWIWSNHNSKTLSLGAPHRMRPFPNHSGYWMCYFSGTYRLVHRIVLEAFVGPCPEGMECRHLDRDRKNDRLENLTWGTRLENLMDKRRHQTVWHPKGRLNGRVTLTEDQVAQIFALDSQGFSYKAIQAAIPCSRYRVKDVLSGRHWGHLGFIRKKPPSSYFPDEAPELDDFWFWEPWEDAP